MSSCLPFYSGCETGMLSRIHSPRLFELTESKVHGILGLGSLEHLAELDELAPATAPFSFFEYVATPSADLLHREGQQNYSLSFGRHINSPT